MRPGAAFSFDAVAWLGPGEARSMKPAERGVYIDLLAYQCQKGFIPAKDVEAPDMLARLTNTTADEFAAIWRRIQHKFTRNSAGDYVNAKLAEVMTPARADMPAGKVVEFPAQQSFFGDSEPAAKKQKKGNPDIGRLTAHYCQQWVTTHRPADGKPPRLNRADKGQAATLVRDYGLNRAIEFVDRYLRDCDPWFADKGHPLSLIIRKVNQYRKSEDSSARRGSKWIEPMEAAEQTEEVDLDALLAPNNGGKSK